MSPTLDANWLTQARGWLAGVLDDTAGALPEEARLRLVSLGRHLHRTVLPVRLAKVRPKTVRYSWPSCTRKAASRCFASARNAAVMSFAEEAATGSRKDAP